MLETDLPTKIVLPFANSAGPGFKRPIPVPSQIGIQAGAASFTDGFPPANFLPLGAGGTPPWGEDFNGILNQLSAWARWQAIGGSVPYDPSFVATVGGVPLGALIASRLSVGYYWFNQVDGNTNDPDVNPTGWQPVAMLGGTNTTGAWTWRPTAEDLPGWVKANGTTIGSGSSGASQLASSVAKALFLYSWTNFSNTSCPVSGGRGASALADWNANKTIGVLDMRGYSIGGMDTMSGSPTTRLSGVPVTLGSATTAGSVLGENFHVLVIGEIPAHAHPITDPSHNHGHSDPSHAHGVTDPTHRHTYTVHSTTFSADGGGIPGTWKDDNNGAFTSFASTGVSVNSNTTGITNTSNTTGITVSDTGGGLGHNTYHLSRIGTHYWKL
jgi:hypothetical protein